jgi:hypothetical protein
MDTDVVSNNEASALRLRLEQRRKIGHLLRAKHTKQRFGRLLPSHRTNKSFWVSGL